MALHCKRAVVSSILTEGFTKLQLMALSREPDSDRAGALPVICHQLNSLPSHREAEIDFDPHVATKKPVREPLPITGPARKDEIFASDAPG